MSKPKCSIDGCEDPIRGHGWCGKHLKRWQKYGNPLTVHPKGAAATPEAEAERRRKIGEAHSGREKGPLPAETRRKLSEALTLPDDRPPGYWGAHRRVRRARGPAKYQTCVTCGKDAQHWAHIHDTDPASPQNYQAMCARCHTAYDQTIAKSLATKGPDGLRAQALKAWDTKRRKRASA